MSIVTGLSKVKNLGKSFPFNKLFINDLQNGLIL
nr:MAG TPA: hypothetical protein [Caudoviricetes sp.]